MVRIGRIPIHIHAIDGASTVHPLNPCIQPLHYWTTNQSNLCRSTTPPLPVVYSQPANRPLFSPSAPVPVPVHVYCAIQVDSYTLPTEGGKFHGDEHPRVSQHIIYNSIRSHCMSVSPTFSTQKLR